jgi:hypothetical protein
MVQPARQDLTWVRGDDYQVTLTMTTNGTTGINIGGWSAIAAQVRSTPNAVDEQPFAVTIVDQTNGVVRLQMNATQSSAFPTTAVWDLQRVSSGALQTVVSGFVTCEPDVTRT